MKLKLRLIKHKKKLMKLRKRPKRLKITLKKLKKQKNLAIQKQLTLRQTKQKLPLMTLSKLQTVYQMIVKMVLATREMILILTAILMVAALQILTLKVIQIQAVIQEMALAVTQMEAQTAIQMAIPMMKTNLTIHQLKMYLQTTKTFQACQKCRVMGNKYKSQETQLSMKLLSN